MQPTRKLETLVYAIFAVVTLLITGIALFVITRYADKQQNAVAQAATSSPIPVTLTVTASPTSLPPTFTRTSVIAISIPPKTSPPTSTPTLTVRPTWTPSSTASQTLAPSFTALPSATRSSTPTVTPTATNTTMPTATRTLTPTSTLTPSSSPTFTPGPSFTPVPAVPVGDADLFNILLIGSDQRPNDPAYRTDTIIVVSINKNAGTVALLSVPRDLWVNIPGYQTERINTASFVGDAMKYPGGGVALLQTTLSDNLGIKIDRYAKVNFDGFKTLVDSVGGVDLAVDCPVTDYRLADPKLDPTVLANFKPFTLPIGIHHMDGALALWYSRSRIGSSDFERSRRQQQVLRAIWHKVVDRNLLRDLPGLWDQLTRIVDTNISVTDAAGLIPVAFSMDSAHLHSYFLGPRQVLDWTTPAGEQVLLPQADSIRELVKQFYTPPTANRLVSEQSTIEIFNGTPNDGWDQVATSRLIWEGFSPTDSGASESRAFPRTLIYDFTGNAKPASLKTLEQVLNVNKEDVIGAPDPNRAVDFRIVLGASYNACTYSPWRASN